MVHFLYWLLLLVAARPQTTQQNVGTKLVWHYAAGTFAGGEVTIYTLGDRRRTEYHNTAQNRNPDGSFSAGDPAANVVIQRCDLGRSFGLNTKAQAYSEKAYPPKPLTPEERKARGFDNSDWDTSNLPAFRVQTTTVDTGEREEMFGQWARHVITTTKMTPLGDTKGEPSVFVKDGWYIDYDRRISCEPKPAEETETHTFGGIFISGRLMRTQKIETVEVGHRESGLLVKGGQDSSTTAITGSNGVNVSLSNDIQVTEFYRGPLDLALFEVPEGFKLGDTVLFQ
ncbi:MAG TPA: hypothetical protein VEG64_01785 [Candidatus Sulfotelmatobacter sp.]|nr:hypothetical protein [Candidatus Sulfotelmatobacter sp.]